MTTAIKYKPYPKYKPSGIDWLGKIPDGWEAKRLRFLTNLQKGRKPEENTESVDGLPYLTMDFLRGQEEPTKYAPAPESVVIDDGDVLLLWDGANAGEFVKGSRGILSSTMARVSFSPKLNSKYYFYFLTVFEKKLRELTIGMGIPHVSGDIVKDCITPVPSIPEQKSIADFLDGETARIDDVMVKKQKLIELLKEKLQALITRAVTKGLDLKAKMKPSGIDWLGEIPDGWDVKRLRFVIKVSPSKQEVETVASDSEVSFIPMESVSEDGEVDLGTTKTLEEVIEGYTYFRNGDVVVAKITPCFENGKGAIMENLINGIGFGTTEFHVLRATDIDKKYLFLLTTTYPFHAFGEANMKGAAGQKRVPEEFVKDFLLGFPSLKEQRAIVAFLDHETGKINEVMKKIETQIEKLQEYRQALISNAVTGKIKV
mgnify:CR=1 FL=1